jgi:cyclomaltodextrinase / maltogenic alpha-amylase / neopullulanase
LQNLIDSHDTDRLASMIVNAGRRPYSKPDRFDFDTDVSPRYMPSFDVRKPNDEERRIQRMVALLQMTYMGAPMIYYGTESGMWGADDPCDRMPMVWPELKYDPQSHDPLGRDRQADAVAFDESLFSFYRAAIRLRHENAALRRGDLRFIVTDDAAQFLAFQRSLRDDTFLVGFNRGDAPFKWQIPTGSRQDVLQIFTASGNVDKFPIERHMSRTTVTVPQSDAVVLRLVPKE